MEGMKFQKLIIKFYLFYNYEMYVIKFKFFYSEQKITPTSKMEDFREVLFGSSLNNLLGKLFTPHYTPICLKTALIQSAYQALNPTVIIFNFKGGGC